MGQRIAAASGGKGLMIAGAVIAFLVVVGLVVALTGRGDDTPPRGNGSPQESAPPPERAAAPPQTAPAYREPPPTTYVPTAPLGETTPTTRPVAIATPSPVMPPTARPSAAPSSTPVTLGPPTPLPPRPSPSPVGPPAPVVVRPEIVEPSEAPAGEVEGPVERLPPSPAPSANVSGRWVLSNRVVSTSHDAFRGLDLGYSLTLQQDGTRVTGSGVKVTENGSPAGQRTPISVSGRIVGSSVVLTFTEQGAARESAGTFRWQLSADGRSLAGSFWSDVADAKGPSSARRIQ